MWIFTFFSTLLYTLLALASHPTDALSGWLNGTTTWQADFVQTTPAQNLTLTGTVYLQRASATKASQLRWDYASGEKLYRLADGRAYWVSANGVVTQLPTTHPLLHLFGKEAVDLSNPKLSFTLEALPAGDLSGADPTQRFRLLPKNPNDPSSFVRTDLAFDPNQGLLSLQTTDQLEQQTQVTFQNTQRNAVLPAQTFAFTPPHSAD